MVVNGQDPAATSESDTAWFNDRLRRVSFEFQLQDKEPFALSRLDPEFIAQEWARAKVNFVFVQAKDNQGNTFYNTKIGNKHAGLGDRDWLEEIVEAARKYDIKIGCYFNFSRDNRMWYLKPNWRQLWQDGTPRGEVEQQNPDWDNMCHNSPYRDYILSLLHEITANYDIHGYWMDRLDWGGKLPDKFSCSCEYCQAKFQAEIGAPIPTTVNWNDPIWRRFVHWRSECLRRYMAEIRHTIKSVKPNVVMALNYYGPLDMFGVWFHGQDPETALENVDSLTPEVHYEREGYIALSVFSRFNRGASGGKPFDLDIFRHSGDVDYITKPSVQLQAEVLTTVANGGTGLVDDQVYGEGLIEPRAYDVIGESFEQIERREPWMRNSVPVKFAALFYSKNSRTFYGRNQPQPYLWAFLGAYKALLEAHTPFDVITDRALTADGLEGYQALVLPDAACLSDEQVQVVRDFVERGGRLVATHRTSLMNELGDPRPDFGLADVFGTSYVDLVTLSMSYVKVKEASPLTAGVAVDLPLVHRGHQLKVRPVNGRVTPAVITYAREEVNRVSHFSDPPSDQDSPYPALVAGEFGAGRVVYFPGRPDAIFGQWGHPEYKDLLNNALTWATEGLTSPLEVDAPISVEATLHEQPDENRLIVHLVNFQSDPGRSVALVSTKFMG